MKPEHIAQAFTIHEGRKAAKTGRKLLDSAQTPEEQEVARAFKRVSIGTIALVLILVVGLLVLTPWSIAGLHMEEGISRLGTVQANGQEARYIKNEPVVCSLEALGLQNCGLQPGDKVILYFDTVTDEFIAAYPQVMVEQRGDFRLGILFAAMILMVVVILFYAIVICRYTPFGSAWYLYCKRKRHTEAEELPRRTRIAINAAATVIALAICWPGLVSIVENYRQLQQIGERARQIQELGAAVDHATDVLETLGQEVDASGAISDAADAASNIKEILDGIPGD